MKASTFKQILTEFETDLDEITILFRTSDDLHIPNLINKTTVNGRTFLILSAEEISEDHAVSLEIEEMTTGNEFVKINNQNDEDNNEN